MARPNRLALWSLGEMRGFATAGDGEDSLWWPVHAELASDARGTQLYLVPHGTDFVSSAELRDLERTSKAYHQYRGRPPNGNARAACIETPGRAVKLGKILHVVYVRQNGKTYSHKFGSPRPELLEHSNGQLVIRGGRYHVGPAGIVG